MQIQNIVEKKFFIMMLFGISVFQAIIMICIDTPRRISFLNVGQGDSTLFQIEDKYVLVDGGIDESSLNKISAKLPFWDKNIDIIIGTHADSDHIKGLIPIFEQYSVGVFMINSLDYEDENLKKILSLASRNGTKVLEFKGGGRIKFDDKITFKAIWPPKDIEISDDNQGSLVILVEMDGSEILLTADIEEEQEKQIIESYNLESVDVIKVGHHGSDTASSQEFIDATSPSIAVFSVGKNTYGHPKKSILDKFQSANVHIFRTDLNGTINLEIENGIIHVKTER